MILDIPTIENFCSNSCFIILFITTLYYWWKTILATEGSYNQNGLIGYVGALICLTIHLVLRWFESGHFPLSNLYESLIFLSWSLLILHVYLEKSMKTFFLGVLTSPAILCLVAFTDFSLPPDLQQSSPLVPALQSNWLVMHVTVMIGSYAALLLGCLMAISYLIFSKFLNRKKQLDFFEDSKDFIPPSNIENGQDFSVTSSLILKTQNLSQAAPKDTFVNFAISKNEKSSTFLTFLDNLSYRTIGIGFCLLTLGILSGAVWANETWGNYWSWDPKETWAFITWLTFASYLHSRLIGGWAGSKPAWIASFGFVIVWVCYLGVNLLGQGLHSYGFLQI